MVKFTRDELAEGIRYKEYSHLFKKKIGENEVVEIRKGSVILKSLLLIIIGAIVIVFAFYFSIFLFSEVLDVDMTRSAGRIAITACGIILFVIYVTIFTKSLTRVRRVKTIGDKIKKPAESVLNHIDGIITEITTGSMEDNPKLIEFDSIRFAGSMYEKRERWLNPEGGPGGLSEKELKNRTLTNLYNQRPTWLALAHEKLDKAVLEAYGWPHDISDEEILERLLGLNLERARE